MARRVVCARPAGRPSARTSPDHQLRRRAARPAAPVVHGFVQSEPGEGPPASEDTDVGEWSSNVRFNIIHRPLSDFFLVYNERRDQRTDALIDRAVIAKVTYMVAF